MKIDAHQHFWDRSMTEFDHSWQENPGFENICHSFLPDDLHPLISEVGIQRTVLVQTQHNIAETQWFLSLSDEFDFVAGVVGWVDLESEQCQGQLEPLMEHPCFVGVRHVVQDEADDDFIVRPTVLNSLKVLAEHNVPYDLLFYEKHLRHATTVADHIPDGRFVIDHLSKPAIKSGSFEQWAKELAFAAKRENVWCKISGMITEANWANWSVDDLRRYVDTALECFGPERLMFGSDWPVCLLAGTYKQVYDAASQCLAALSDTEQQQVFGKTASDFYSLQLENV